MADDGDTELQSLFKTARLPDIKEPDAVKLLPKADQDEQIRGLRMVTVFNETVSPVVADQQKAANGGSYDPDLYKIIQDRIDVLDRLIAARLNDVLHDVVRKADGSADADADAPGLQKLEATWRGLHYLVFNTETSSRLKLRVLDVTQKELGDDLEKALDFDQSALFKKVYEEEYGTLGGKPYGCLVAALSFDRSAPSLKLRKNRASVAAACADCHWFTPSRP